MAVVTRLGEPGAGEPRNGGIRAEAPQAEAPQVEGPEQTDIPAHVLPHRSSAQLLQLAAAGLAEAESTRAEGLRYATAHLAALRIAAAMVAARARPVRKRRRGATVSVWTLLATVAPEFAEWAMYFASGAAKRAAAEAGIGRVVTAREADDLLRAVVEFLGLVQQRLGEPPLLPPRPSAPLNHAG